MGGMTVAVRTVDKWIQELDPDRIWLKYERQTEDVAANSKQEPQVSVVRCAVCQEFESRIRGIRNFNRAIIDGLRGSSLKKDNVKK